MSLSKRSQQKDLAHPLRAAVDFGFLFDIDEYPVAFVSLLTSCES